MLNMRNFKSKLYNASFKCGPVKSLFEVESFLRNICKVKKSLGFAKQTKNLINKKWEY